MHNVPCRIVLRVNRFVNSESCLWAGAVEMKRAGGQRNKVGYRGAAGRRKCLEQVRRGICAGAHFAPRLLKFLDLF